MSTSTEENLCPVCRENIIFYGYSVCNHPFCSKCIIKLRMFENRVKDLDLSCCPTCRTKFEKIVIMERFIPFDKIDFSSLLFIKDFDIYFGSSSANNHYESLISCICIECGEKCANMSALNRHCNKQHYKMYCDLCLRHARLLPHEFPLYNRPELSEHRKWDKNKGHPPCDFCETRFYDFDELVAHIREKHFYCDLCLRTRIHVFFNSQKDLMSHYSVEHFVCQECKREDKTNVFICDIDLKAHRLREHAAGRQKAELREEGSIPLEIRYNTPSSGTNASVAASDRRYRGNRARDAEEDIIVIPPKPADYEATAEDFPTLGSAATNGSMPRIASWNGNVSTISGNLQQEDFPSLNSNAAKPVIGGAWTNKHTASHKTTKISSGGGRKQFSSARSSPNMEADYPTLSTGVGPPPPVIPTNSGASMYSSLLGDNYSRPIQPTHAAHHRPNFSIAGDNKDFPSLPAAVAPPPPPPSSVGWMLNATANVSPNKFSPSVNQSALSAGNPPTKKSKKKKKTKSKPAAAEQPSNNAIKPGGSNSLASTTKVSDTAWKTVKNGAKIDTDDSDTDNSDSDDDFPTLSGAHGQYGNQFTALKSMVEPSIVPINLLSYTDTQNPLNHSKPSKQPPNLTKDEFPSLLPTKKPPNNTPIAAKNAAPKKQEKSKDFTVNNSRFQSQKKQDSSAFTLRDLASSLQNFVYHSPPDFEQRNFDLINVIQSSLSPDRFNDFVSIAGSYRQRLIDAETFLKGCRTLMTEDIQTSCLPEMLVLLPEIGLQRDFFAAIPNAWRVDLRECYVCGQVCRLCDLSYHMSHGHADH